MRPGWAGRRRRSCGRQTAAAAKAVLVGGVVAGEKTGRRAANGRWRMNSPGAVPLLQVLDLISEDRGPPSPDDRGRSVAPGAAGCRQRRRSVRRPDGHGRRSQPLILDQQLRPAIGQGQDFLPESVGYLGAKLRGDRRGYGSRRRGRRSRRWASPQERLDRADRTARENGDGPPSKGRQVHQRTGEGWPAHRRGPASRQSPAARRRGREQRQIPRRPERRRGIWRMHGIGHGREPRTGVKRSRNPGDLRLSGCVGALYYAVAASLRFARNRTAPRPKRCPEQGRGGRNRNRGNIIADAFAQDDRIKPAVGEARVDQDVRVDEGACGSGAENDRGNTYPDMEEVVRPYRIGARYRCNWNRQMALRCRRSSYG